MLRRKKIIIRKLLYENVIIFLLCLLCQEIKYNINGVRSYNTHTIQEDPVEIL